MGLLAEVDHPGVMVHLDSYHMNIEENSAGEAVQACGDKLGYVSTPACDSEEVAWFGVCMSCWSRDACASTASLRCC